MSVIVPSNELEIDESLDTHLESDPLIEATKFPKELVLDNTTGEYQHRHELDRRFHAYDWKTYILPNDSVEQNRLDLQHSCFRLAIDGNLYLAPIPENAVVLDVGCGTGKWAIEMALENPNMSVQGVDLSPIQPSELPRNCSFRVQNVEIGWDSDEMFDLIHARAMIIAFSDWLQFFKNCYRHLKPGGYIELHDFCMPTKSLRGVTSNDSPALEYTNAMSTILSSMNRDTSAPAKWEEQLQAAGFKNLHQQWVKWPIGQWPKGQKNKLLGKLFAKNTSEGVNTVAPVFSRSQSWDPERLKKFTLEAQADLLDTTTKNCLYIETCYCYAQKL